MVHPYIQEYNYYITIFQLITEARVSTIGGRKTGKKVSREIDWHHSQCNRNNSIRLSGAGLLREMGR